MDGFGRKKRYRDELQKHANLREQFVYLNQKNTIIAPTNLCRNFHRKKVEIFWNIYK